MSVFDDTIDQVHEEKQAGAAGATPAEDVIAAEGQGASQPDDTSDTQASDQTAEPSLAAGEGAREGEGAEVTQQATEDKTTAFDKLTGLESAEELKARHGDNFAAAFTRRFQPLIKQAGGMPMLRHGADIVAAGNDPSTDGLAFAKTLSSALGPSRWTELRNDIVFASIDAQPEVVLRDLIGDEAVTLEEAKAALADYRQWSGAGQQEGQAASQPDDLSALPEAVRKKLEDYDRLMQEVPGLRQQVTGMVESQRTAQEQAKAKQVDELGQELYGSVFSVVTESVNKLKIEHQPTDSAEVRRIKEDLQELFSQERLEAAFESDPDRKALVERALERVKRLEKDGAFAYRDPLTVMAEKAFEEYVKSPRVAGRLADLNNALRAQSTPKDPSARPEMVAGAPAASAPADAWRNVPKDVDPFDFGVSLAREKTQAAR